jgi:hypothetical protein
MNGLGFIASVIRSLAWPVVLLVIFLVIRKPITALLPFLQRLKFKEMEVEFSKGVKEVSAQVDQELPHVSTEAVPRELGPVARLAEVSPRAAVLEAWRTVEAAALDAARRLQVESFTNQTLTFEALRKLDKDARIDPSVATLLRELRSLRNAAAHAPEFSLSMEAAIEYAASCARVAAYLGSLQP